MLTRAGIILFASRPVNLLIVIITELAVFQSLQLPFDTSAFMFVWASVLTAAGGNILNDIYDREGDILNKPHKAWVGKSISVQAAKVIYLLLSLSGLIISLIVSIKAFVVVLTVTVLLFLYNAYLSKTPLLGNILVAVLTSSVLLVIPVVFNEPLPKILWSIMLTSFYLNLLREMVKDIQDMHGDMVMGRKTLPITWGVKNAAILLAVLMLIPALVSDFIFLGYAYNEGSGAHRGWLLLPALLLFLPFSVAAYFSLQLVKGKNRAKSISSLLKIIMVSGLLLWILQDSFF